MCVVCRSPDDISTGRNDAYQAVKEAGDTEDIRYETLKHVVPQPAEESAYVNLQSASS